MAIYDVDGDAQPPQLPAASPGSPAASIDEKAAVRVAEKHLSSASSLDSHDKLEGEAFEGGEVVYVKGEPVITTGLDVSRFLVDTRDDGDPAITFRSMVIGTVFAGLGAALCQVRCTLYSCSAHAWFCRATHSTIHNPPPPRDVLTIGASFLDLSV